MDVYDSSKRRLQIVGELRKVINGENDVPHPPGILYKPEVQHAYLLRNAVTAKVARFRHFPEIMVSPEYNQRGNVTAQAEKQATKIERWHTRLYEQWEQQSNVWQKVVEDTISFFVGAERIECAPATDWKDVIDLDTEKEEGRYPYEDKDFSFERTAAKRAAGVPIRSIHVPSDAIHWVREGNHTVECFEVEQRNLRAVVSNPLFRESEFVRNVSSRDMKLTEKVTILHYSNNVWHAYYALVPDSNSTFSGRVPSGAELSQNATGLPQLLYAYEHGIGRPVYNIVWGPYGPWEGNVDPMLGRLAALHDLSADADKYKSWLATAVRRLGFPTFQQTFNPDIRDTADQRPKAVPIEEGGIVTMWKDESLTLVPNNFDTSALRYAYEDTERKFHALAGVESQYGIHQEGAATGYHEAFLLQQSQNTERSTEIGLKHGAEGRVDIVNRYVKYRIKEPTPIAHSEIREGSKKRAMQYIELGPDDLRPMPTVTASVIAPSPQDFDKNLANVQRALAPINGRPITDRMTALTRIANFDNPDEIERNIDIEQQKIAAMQNPSFGNYILRRMFSKLASDEAEIASAQQFGQADPSILAAGDMAIQSGEMSQMGGMAPETAMGMEQASIDNAGMTQGMGGGLPEGMAQPMQVMGNTDALMGGMG